MKMYAPAVKMYAPRKPLRPGLLDLAMPSNRSTACSRSIWNFPGTILKRGMTKMRTMTANTSKMPETTMAEISAGLTSLMPKRLILFVSCRTASRMVT